MLRPATLLLLTFGTASPSHATIQLLAPTPRPNPVLIAPADTADRVPPWIPPLASIAVPGSGQLLQGQERGAVYLGVETFLLIRLLTSNADGRRERGRFIDLAFDVARAPFGPSMRDTAFEYFEEMERFVESGPFDSDPGMAGIQPPGDENTFNGSIWVLARRTFLPDPDAPDPNTPEFVRALEFYQQRAVGPNFLWSWRNAGLEQDLFRQAITDSDEAFRRARQQLGLMLANHLLSTLDAFVSHRLSRRQSRVEVDTFLWVPRGERLAGLVMLRIGL